ncbi:MAG: sodium/pantothenate symporter [Caldicoprobacterales bacterium]|jgi:sodium/pantothenate symporter
MIVSPITKGVFFAYFIVLILISLWSYFRGKKSSSFQEEYFVAGRSLGAWVVAFTWATSWTSGGTFIGTPAVYYTYGWGTLLWQAGAAVLGICGMLMIGRRIATFASEHNCVTLPDLFNERFKSNIMGTLAALSIIIFGIAYLVSQYTAAARILETFFGLDYMTAIIVFTAVVAVYTILGGIRGVAYNATLQGIIMLGSSVILAIIMVTKAGGFAAITQAQLAQDPNLIVPPGPKNYLPIATAFSTFFTLGVAVMAQPHVVTRVFTVKNTDSLKMAGALISIICMIWFFSLFISAQAARALIPAIEVPDQIFPTIVIKYTGTFLAGILMCAPFAAVMSTVSSLTLSCSSAVIKDIYQRNFNKNLSEQQMKKVTYIATIIFCIIVVFFSLKPPAFLQDIVMFAINGFAASFTMPIIFGFFWKGSTPAGGLWSMITGFVTMLCLYLLPVQTNLLGFNPLIWGMLVSAIVMVIVSKFTKVKDEEYNKFVEEIFQ